MSPMSGSHTYSFDEEEQLWLSAGTDRYGTVDHFVVLCFVLTADVMCIVRGHCLTRDAA